MTKKASPRAAAKAPPPADRLLPDGIDQIRELAKMPSENPNPVLRVTPKGRVIYANDAARAIGGLIAGGDTASRALAAAAARASRDMTSQEAAHAAGDRHYAFTLTPVAGEAYINVYGRDITDERNARAQIESLARFPSENPNPILRVAGDGALLYANEAAHAIRGLISGKRKKLHAALGDAVKESVRSARRAEAEYGVGGRAFAFAVTPVVGEPYVNVYGRDITEERHAQLEVRSLAKFPEENPNPVLRVTGAGSVLYANKAAAELPGMLRNGGEALAPSLSGVVAEAFRHGQHRLAELPFGERLFALAVTAVPNEAYVNVYGRDITEEHRANREVLRIKNFNQSILDNLSNGIITLDDELTITSANPAVRRIFCVEEGAVEGQTLEDVVGAENRWLIEAARAALGSAKSRILVDKELIGRDGHCTSINLTAASFREADQNYSGVILVFEDITREKRVKGTMVRFMSDAVVERLLEADEGVLSGVTQEVTIVFSDIRGFTSLSEKLGATEMVEILNAYFADMVDIIFECGGTLDKFIGDAIMAVFGAPFQSQSDADNAVSAAVAMLRRLKHFNAARQAEGFTPIDIGVGIDTGVVIAGTIGSPRRMDYTVIGEHVNLASRIETVNKLYGTHILISEFTKATLKNEPCLREVDLVRVAGVEAPLRLYEVLDYHTEESFPNLEASMAAYAQGLESFRKQAWREAAEAFSRGLNLNPGDRPTQIFLSRCWGYMARAPEGSWTGVTNLTR